MVSAPTPGRARAAAKRTPNAGFRLTVGDDVYKLRRRDLGVEDRGLVRNQTGRSFQSFVAEMDIDSCAVIYWLARRKRGERKLTWAQACRDFPTPEEIEDLGDGFDIDWADDVDAEPGVEAEDDDDPLASAGS